MPIDVGTDLSMMRAFLVALFCSMRCVHVCALEPLAPLAFQPLWQAGEPMTVNVDFDVPENGPVDEQRVWDEASAVERQVAARDAEVSAALRGASIS